jgi:DNA-binding transcriptional LysR family regulator
VILEFDNIENIKRAVEIPSGIAILPEPSLAREVRAGTLVLVPLEGNGPEDRLTRPLAIVHRRHGSLDPATAKFLELLTSPDLMRDVADLPESGVRVAAAASSRA